MYDKFYSLYSIWFVADTFKNVQHWCTFEMKFFLTQNITSSACTNCTVRFCCAKIYLPNFVHRGSYIVTAGRNMMPLSFQTSPGAEIFSDNINFNRMKRRAKEMNHSLGKDSTKLGSQIKYRTFSSSSFFIFCWGTKAFCSFNSIASRWGFLYS